MPYVCANIAQAVEVHDGLEDELVLVLDSTVPHPHHKYYTFPRRRFHLLKL